MDTDKMEPRAEEFTRSLCVQAEDFRDHCEQMLVSHEKALGFWKHEYEIVTAFLRENQITDRSEAPEMKSDKKRELEYEMNRRGTTRG